MYEANSLFPRPTNFKLGTARVVAPPMSHGGSQRLGAWAQVCFLSLWRGGTEMKWKSNGKVCEKVV